jgi:hypothetical protein
MKPLLLHSSSRTTNHKKRRVIHIEFSNQELPTALKWAEKSVKLDKNWQNLDTKANLHFVLGNKKAALADAKEAVKMANEIGDDASDTEALIQKIKK